MALVLDDDYALEHRILHKERETSLSTLLILDGAEQIDLLHPLSGL